MLTSLGGKTAIVTGGARRVGFAIARELHSAGARLVIHARREVSREIRAELSGACGEVVVVTADLRELQSARAIVDAAVAATGRVDILVNSAADYARTPLAELTDEAWDAMLALNLSAPMRLSREAIRAGASAIVNMVDVGAWQPWPNHAAYTTAKAGLLHLTRTLACELAPRVRVNAVAPGTVAFPEEWSAEKRAKQLAKIPLGRVGDPTDVARAVRFLIENDYLTGVVLPVDGGAGLR